MSRFAFIPRVLCKPFRYVFCSAMMAGLLGAAGTAQAGWFTVSASGCQGWWPGIADTSKYEWEWSGACENGKIQGQGTLKRIDADEYHWTTTGFFQEGFLYGQYDGLTVNDMGKPYVWSRGHAVYGLAESYTAEKKSWDGPEDPLRVSYYGQDGEHVGRYTENSYSSLAYKDSDGNEMYQVVEISKNPWAVETYKEPPLSDKKRDKHKFPCADSNACERLFQQKVTEFGMTDLRQERMAAIDNSPAGKKGAAGLAKAEAEQAAAIAKAEAERVAAEAERVAAEAEKAAALAKAQAEHAQLLAKGPPEKLYGYASRKERERDYEGALEALLAIVENFPKSDFTASAMERAGTIQDKLDVMKEKEQAAKRQEQEAEAQQQAAEARQAQQARLYAEQKAQSYQVCQSQHTACMSQCESGHISSMVSGAASQDIASYLSGMIGGLSRDCPQCDAIQQQCEAYR